MNLHLFLHVVAWPVFLLTAFANVIYLSLLALPSLRHEFSITNRYLASIGLMIVSGAYLISS